MFKLIRFVLKLIDGLVPVRWVDDQSLVLLLLRVFFAHPSSVRFFAILPADSGTKPDTFPIKNVGSDQIRIITNKIGQVTGFDASLFNDLITLVVLIESFYPLS